MADNDMGVLQDVSVQAQFRHRQLDYEQLRYTMLAFLVNTEAKLKQWTKKLTREQDVQAVLADYNVSLANIRVGSLDFWFLYKLYPTGRTT